MGAKMRSQSAIEYMFMLAAALIMVLIAMREVLTSFVKITKAVNAYVTQVRKQVLENL